MKPTKIEYLDMTWNPIAMRCTPVSDGCDNCWHLRMAKRMSGFFADKSLYGTAQESKAAFKKHEAYDGGKPYLDTYGLSAPIRRRKPTRIGVQFMGDLFHESIPFEWIAAVYRVMAAAPQHQFFVLTKRPERRFEFSRKLIKGREWLNCRTKMLFEIDPPNDDFGPQTPTPATLYYSCWPLPNVLEGVSVENQKTADERIPILINTPAAKLRVSYEPALGPVEIEDYILNCQVCGNLGSPALGLNEPGSGHDLCRACSKEYLSPSVDWVVAGSETGPGARPADLDWFRSVRDQCAASGVPFFFKRDLAGSRLLDGRTHEELP